MKKAALFVTGIFTVLLLSLSFKSVKEASDIGAANTTAVYNRQVRLFIESAQELSQAIDAVNADSVSVVSARLKLLDCRLAYKRLSYFTSYFFPSETRLYNAPAKYEVEEPELELVEPMGLQQIEGLLFEQDVLTHKKELLAQADVLLSSVKVLPSLMYQFSANDRQVLESIRVELVRMQTLYITGFDAPFLKSGIQETRAASEAIEEVLQPYFAFASGKSSKLRQILHSSIAYLSTGQDFDTFNRMEYLTGYALPLQEELGIFIRQLGLELNTTSFIDYQAPNLFSSNYLKDFDSIPPAQRMALAAFGRSLFSDKALSGTGTVSCASCHRPENYFTDGTIKSPSILKDSVLKRHTPTLLYAGRQHSQFWDGRAKNLPEQVMDVLLNPLEMGGSEKELYKHISKNSGYTKTLQQLFPGKQSTGQSLKAVSAALAAFVSELSPMNSKFDQYIRGDKTAMNAAQIKGFNLFMGKAQCGTCHFAPYFNSLTPPLYDLSEVEVLGTPASDDFKQPKADTDMGRYDLYQIRYYKQAFKTPTVRNAERTAPYMHNGSFRTLESVVEFYNQGGGRGIGLPVEEQTLPAKALKLSQEESDQLVQFIHSLTDSAVSSN